MIYLHLWLDGFIPLVINTIKSIVSSMSNSPLRSIPSLKLLQIDELFCIHIPASLADRFDFY